MFEVSRTRDNRLFSGLSALPFDPTTGNDPLHFGSSNRPLTECPSLENTAENSKKRKITGLTS
ncbi:Cystathionine beta-lyase, partial [Dissostichus eleginoides]